MVENSETPSAQPLHSSLERTSTIRPLAGISDFVVTELPHLLAHDPKLVVEKSKELLQSLTDESVRAASKSPQRNVAILDLKILRSAIVQSGLQSPEKLATVIRTLVGNELPTLTYEDIIINNPTHDRRLFSEGEVAVDEEKFYKMHEEIETLLQGMIDAVRSATEALRRGVGTSDCGLPAAIASLKDAREKFQLPITKLTGTLAHLKHFGKFRHFFNPMDGHKGPSGAFTARFPIFEILLRGDRVGLKRYIYENALYFPRSGRQAITSDIFPNFLEKQNSLFSLWEKIANEVKVEPHSQLAQDTQELGELQEDMWKSLDIWRRVHTQLVKRQVPEVFSGAVGGTGGEQSAKKFLESRQGVSFPWPEYLRPRV